MKFAQKSTIHKWGKKKTLLLVTSDQAHINRANLPSTWCRCCQSFVTYTFQCCLTSSLPICPHRRTYIRWINIRIAHGYTDSATTHEPPLTGRYVPDNVLFAIFFNPMFVSVSVPDSSKMEDPIDFLYVIVKKIMVFNRSTATSWSESENFILRVISKVHLSVLNID